MERKFYHSLGPQTYRWWFDHWIAEFRGSDTVVSIDQYFHRPQTWKGGKLPSEDVISKTVLKMKKDRLNYIANEWKPSDPFGHDVSPHMV